MVDDHREHFERLPDKFAENEEIAGGVGDKVDNSSEKVRQVQSETRSDDDGLTW